MAKLNIPKPPDPRPSKAHPEHRAKRKELEKKHGGYEWVPYLGLALTGLVLAFDVEKDVEKREKRKDRQDQEPNNNGRRDRGESSRRHKSRDSRREEDRSSGRDRHRSLDRDYDQDRYRYQDRGREERDHGREIREDDRPRLEGRPRDYEYYDGGRREYVPWDDRRGYDRRPAW
ncbi:hypothetical protein CONLIGDRAFT_259749 [Coniochaeta ligniaria NRRL 30616]|uniref:Uncharacterized protein n=1 Tax=Coniochaeta ligniaria NRRL 30616 TaxID=1408157 RepID=A0A1J7JWM8_9PEZI|nr:hypothetical protein CONLIGDRAFT_259749 [Coniochaeta ligniaria NRRL 30616]